ncbi:uncharacterized protein LOC144158522 isoform X2 [Haemaphysalis longicornis]
MSVCAVSNRDVFCSHQQTQTAVTTSARGAQCALTFLISASSQTEEDFPAWDTDKTQAGASEKVPALGDGADIAVEAGPHTCSCRPCSGNRQASSCCGGNLFLRDRCRSSPCLPSHQCVGGCHGHHGPCTSSHCHRTAHATCGASDTCSGGGSNEGPPKGGQVRGARFDGHTQDIGRRDGRRAILASNAAQGSASDVQAYRKAQKAQSKSHSPER